MKFNQILNGDVREIARTLEPNSIQTIITSPPYFGLRKYSQDAVESQNEIGREQTISEYIDELVSVFEDLKTALKNDGTVWVNLGDSYIKGNLQGAPWRFALAMQENDWILRSDIIWHKPNAMPSSVKNRPTTDHEYIFLFTLDPKNYFYNADAIREEHVTFSENSKMRGGRNHLGKKMGHLNKERIKETPIYMMGDGTKLFILLEETKEPFGIYHLENIEVLILQFFLKNLLKRVCWQQLRKAMLY